MKLTSILNNIISEVGEGSAKPYEFRVVDQTTNGNENAAFSKVSFETEDGDKYEVTMNAYWGEHYGAEQDGPHFTIDFGIKEGGFLDTDTVVSKGRLFKVMATIVQIAKGFMNYINYKENYIDQLMVSPTKTDGAFDDRRANLYMAYIKRQLPIKRISYDGDTIIAIIK